jgi:hypothetical protein
MKRFVAANLGLMIVLVGSTAYGQTRPYNQNLEPLRPLIGKWTGEFTLSKDMGDLGSAGDTIPVMAIYRLTPNRQAVALSAAAKVGDEWMHVTDGLIIYDPGQKKITGMDTYADGGVFHYVIEPKGDKLICRGHGSTSDGVLTEQTVICSDMQHDSFTGQVVDQKEGDKQIPDGKPYTLKRVTE